MGGYFGAISHRDVGLDVFFGTDYHSHLGTRRGGMVVYGPETGFVREIHDIENTPFRTKFESALHEFKGHIGMGCISDTDPQPLLVRSHLGLYAICTVGIINNIDELIDTYFSDHGHQFMAQSSGKVNVSELVAALINMKENLVEGILYAQEMIKGSITILLMTPDGILAARDRLGRLPVLVGSNYEGVNVEVMRYRNGEIMARDEVAQGRLPKVDYVAGVPDSGVPHAIGFANRSGKPFARPFVKYTPTWPRSFTPANQEVRNQVAKMKQIPVSELIQGKKLLFVDDSIVRGTQLRETVDFLYESGAEEVHMRSACPPIMYSCKYLNFSRGNSDMELLARRVIQELEGDEGHKHLDEYSDSSTERGQCLLKSICEKFGFDSLGYQSLDGVLEAIGIDRDKVCTYCWNGKE